MNNKIHNCNTFSSNKNTQNSCKNNNNVSSSSPSKVSSQDSGSESDTDVRVFSIVQNACLGAFISGYTGSELSLQYKYIVMNIPDIDPNNTYYQRAFTAVFVIGGLMGAIIYSQLQKQATKRNIMILADLILIASVIFQFDEWKAFGLQRLLKGVANGINLCAVLVYIREVSGEKRADASIALFQINVNVGIVMATVISLRLPFYSETDSTYWKFLLCFPALPALLRAYVLIFWYDFDTPFSLLQRNKTDAASKVLFMLGQLGYDEEERKEGDRSLTGVQELTEQQQQPQQQQQQKGETKATDKAKDEEEEEERKVSQSQQRHEVDQFLSKCSPQSKFSYQYNSNSQQESNYNNNRATDEPSKEMQQPLLEVRHQKQEEEEEEEKQTPNVIDISNIREHQAGETYVVGEIDDDVNDTGSFIVETESINQQIQQEILLQTRNNNNTTEIHPKPIITTTSHPPLLNYFFTDLQLRLTEVQDSLSNYSESNSASFRCRWIYGAIAFGIQQLSGINSIVSLVNESIKSPDNDPQSNSESDNVILFLNILLLLIAICVYFNINRLYATRKFIIWGCLLAGVTLIPLAFLREHAPHSSGSYGQTICVAVFLLAFNSSLGPLIIVYVSYICKDVSISRAFISYWICYFLSQCLQQYSDDSYVTPLIYAFSCFVGAYFFYKYSMIEQTQRKSYLELDRIFAKQKEEEGVLVNATVVPRPNHHNSALIQVSDGIAEDENENEDAD